MAAEGRSVPGNCEKGSAASSDQRLNLGADCFTAAQNRALAPPMNWGEMDFCCDPLHDHSSYVILCMSCAARGQLAEAGDVLLRRTQPK